MSETRIRILLVDDHAVVREGLRALLEQQDDIEIVGEADNGRMALQRVPLLEPDVVMLDMKMPGDPEVYTIAAIKRASPQSQVLLFTSYAEYSQVRDALNAGATGYLLKDVLRNDLLRAVREVAAGRAWLHPQAQRQMIDWMRRPASPLDALTSRERSVLQALGEGLSNKQ